MNKYLKTRGGIRDGKVVLKPWGPTRMRTLEDKTSRRSSNLNHTLWSIQLHLSTSQRCKVVMPKN